ncbi:MAG: hypothetical protein LAP21_08490 [Acidobacteriia bacterium]|nr:hypothetical protein [Terriglobia bacterium]
MDAIFRRFTITSIPALLAELRPVRFPESEYLSAVEVIELKRDIRCNCDLVICYSYHKLRTAAMLSEDHIITLSQLLRDAHEVRRECGKVSVAFMRPRHKRILAGLRGAYEEMRLAAILVCQHGEPALIDSLTVAL